MNKKNLTVWVFIVYLVVISVITVAIIVGKEEKKSPAAVRQFKKPAAAKTEGKREYPVDTRQGAAADSGKEFESQIKGPLLM